MKGTPLDQAGQIEFITISIRIEAKQFPAVQETIAIEIIPRGLSVGVLKEAIIDFDGDFVTSAQFQQGSWNLPSQTVSSFRGLFTTGAPAFLDADKNGVVNQTDANIVINKILAKVRQDYDPYHITVFSGDQDA